MQNWEELLESAGIPRNSHSMTLRARMARLEDLGYQVVPAGSSGDVVTPYLWKGEWRISRRAAPYANKKSDSDCRVIVEEDCRHTVAQARVCRVEE